MIVFLCDEGWLFSFFGRQDARGSICVSSLVVLCKFRDQSTTQRGPRDWFNGSGSGVYTDDGNFAHIPDNTFRQCLVTASKKLVCLKSALLFGINGITKRTLFDRIPSCQ